MLQLEVTSPNPDKLYETAVIDYFLYEESAGRLPSLLLLPGCFIQMAWERGEKHTGRRFPMARHLWKSDTGILRRGADKVLLVAQLEVPNHDNDLGVRSHTEICVLHAAGGSSLEWEMNRAVPIVHDEATAGEAEELMQWWETDAAISVSGRFLCFVDYLYDACLSVDSSTSSHTCSDIGYSVSACMELFKLHCHWLDQHLRSIGIGRHLVTL